MRINAVKKRRSFSYSAVPLYLVKPFTHSCPEKTFPITEEFRPNLLGFYAFLSAARGGVYSVYRIGSHLPPTLCALFGFLRIFSRQCLLEIQLYLFYTTFLLLSTKYYPLSLLFLDFFIKNHKSLGIFPISYNLCTQLNVSSTSPHWIPVKIS